MKKQYKLWYDKVEQIAGIQPKEKLLGKVYEEALEVKDATSLTDLIDELGDLLNVTAMTLIKVNGSINYEDMLKKMLLRGPRYGT